MGKGCPHKHIQFCPLYIAAHGLQHSDGSWLGCIDGKEGANSPEPCVVTRRLDYARELRKVTEADPRMVAEAAFKEEAWEEQVRAQARRSARLRRLH